MGIRNFPFVSIGTSNATNVDPGATTPAATAIPLMESGTKARFVYLTVTGGAAFDYIVITPSQGGNGAVATGLPLVTGNDGIILNVTGFTHIGHEANAGSMRLHIYPLEDF